jgi:hypothetical protein
MQKQFVRQPHVSRQKRIPISDYAKKIEDYQYARHSAVALAFQPSKTLYFLICQRQSLIGSLAVCQS